MVKTTNRTKNKKALQPVRTTISMPAILFAVAANKCNARGYATISDYLQSLIRRDGGLDQAA